MSPDAPQLQQKLSAFASRASAVAQNVTPKRLQRATSSLPTLTKYSDTTPTTQTIAYLSTPPTLKEPATRLTMHYYTTTSRSS